MGEFSFWQVDRHEIAKDFPTTLLAECGQTGPNMFKMDKKWYFKFFIKFFVTFHEKSFHVIPCQLHVGINCSWTVKLQDFN